MPQQDLSDLDESLYSLPTSSDINNDYNDDNLSDCDEYEDCYVSDMKGLQILPVDKIATAIRNDMCCKKCAISGHKNFMKEFIEFADEYESVIKKEEDEQLFYS